MKRYTINGQVTVSCWTIVEANSPEEALQIASLRGLGEMASQSLYPDADECFHFEGDGEPEGLRVEGEAE